MDSQEQMSRLVRESVRGMQEVAHVTSPGARTSVWAIRVKSHVSYNVYNVAALSICDPGSPPSEIGWETQAVNMAESFMQQGTLSAGTYAIMFRVGDKNIFYVAV